jgi:hypothetical protein
VPSAWRFRAPINMTQCSLCRTTQCTPSLDPPRRVAARPRPPYTSALRAPRSPSSRQLDAQSRSFAGSLAAIPLATPGVAWETRLATLILRPAPEMARRILRTLTMPLATAGGRYSASCALA